jgi:hypothetical protein
MKLEIQCDPNEVEYINTKLAIVTQKLSNTLALLLPALQADDLKRTTFIGRGLDGVAVVESATKAENAATEHAATFKLPAEEVERNRQFEADARAARKALRW